MTAPRDLQQQEALINFHKRWLADRYVDFNSMPRFKFEEFPSSGPLPWLDRTNAEALVAQKAQRGEISAEQAQQCLSWSRNGFLLIPGLFQPSEVDEVWQAYLKALNKKCCVPLNGSREGGKDPYFGRTPNAHLVVPSIKHLMLDPKLLTTLELLFGHPAEAIQSLTFQAGSEQRDHSDAIHMATFPLGYVIAAWIALEDVHPDAGPLRYYPGSHRLPYIFSRELGIELEQDRSYAQYIKKYEPAIARQILESGIKEKMLLARKGDVFLWHGNLVHGGIERRNLFKTRKSIVVHYYARGSFCFHDLSGEKLSSVIEKGE